MSMIVPPLPFASLCGRALQRLVVLCTAFTFAGYIAIAQGSDRQQNKEAETAALSLTAPLEKDGFAFRADSWTRVLTPQMGRAVRVQLFKGNNYRFCIAVPESSGVRITATVLDFDGKPRGDIRTVEQGWGLVLSFKPKKTGLYAIAIRQTTDGKAVTVPCSLITGYR
jgi:hypothetical protein